MPAALEYPPVSEGSGATADALFLANIRMIQQLARSIAADHGFTASDVDDFVSEVHVRMINDNYGVLRKFRHDCSLKTFLAVVLRRMCLDYRIAAWGKWRSSARSRREGALSVLLERLMLRDGLTFDEACSVLETKHNVCGARVAMASFASRLRPRSRAHVVHDEGLLTDVPAIDAADELVLRADAAKLVSKATRLVAAKISALSAQDRLILALRFSEGLSIAQIARLLRMRQKPLYPRIRRILAILRDDLEAAGITGSELMAVIGRTDVGPGTSDQRRRSQTMRDTCSPGAIVSSSKYRVNTLSSSVRLSVSQQIVR